MKSSLALILALVSPPSSGWAEDRSGPMLALLRRLPAEMVEPAPGGWTEIQFVDHRAAAASVPAMAGGVDASAPRNVHARIGMSTFGPALAKAAELIG